MENAFSVFDLRNSQVTGILRIKKKKRFTMHRYLILQVFAHYFLCNVCIAFQMKRKNGSKLSQILPFRVRTWQVNNSNPGKLLLHISLKVPVFLFFVTVAPSGFQIDGFKKIFWPHFRLKKYIKMFVRNLKTSRITAF